MFISVVGSWGWIWDSVFCICSLSWSFNVVCICSLSLSFNVVCIYSVSWSFNVCICFVSWSFNVLNSSFTQKSNSAFGKRLLDALACVLFRNVVVLLGFAFLSLLAVGTLCVKVFAVAICAWSAIGRVSTEFGVSEFAFV